MTCVQGGQGLLCASHPVGDGQNKPTVHQNGTKGIPDASAKEYLVMGGKKARRHTQEDKEGRCQRRMNAKQSRHKSRYWDRRRIQTGTSKKQERQAGQTAQQKNC